MKDDELVSSHDLYLIHDGMLRPLEYFDERIKKEGPFWLQWRNSSMSDVVPTEAHVWTELDGKKYQIKTIPLLHLPKMSKHPIIDRFHALQKQYEHLVEMYQDLDINQFDV